MTIKDELRGELLALNADLARLGVEPLISNEVAAKASKHFLRAAVRLTEEELVRDMKKLREL